MLSNAKNVEWLSSDPNSDIVTIYAGIIVDYMRKQNSVIHIVDECWWARNAENMQIYTP